MFTRKEMKKKAKKVVRKHYLILVSTCLIATFLGAEFSGALDFIKQSNGRGGVASEETLSTGTSMGSSQSAVAEAVIDALSDDIDDARRISRELTDEAVQNTKEGKGSAALGRSRGVLAEVVNAVASGNAFVSIVSGARYLGASTDVILLVGIIVSMLLALAVWFFLVNVYKAVSRRIFLESRTYEKVPIQNFLWFLRVRRWMKVSVTMFMTALLYMLWSLTIVGGIIKRYSYFMVPYIVAENPDINWRSAITLSRRMMDGHKKECFVFELSFAPWMILGSATLGLAGLLFVNPYITASFSEYYAQIRRIAKANQVEDSELMNDRYLFEKADEPVIRAAYRDVIEPEVASEDEPKLTGFRGLLANVFGITVYHPAEEEKFEIAQERRVREQVDVAGLEGRIYPARLFSIPENERNPRVKNLHYLRHYSIPSLILLFFIFALIGWVWEVSLHLISDGVFVNRGVLHGPWLPIYGTGGVLILVALNKFRGKPAVEFLATLVLCGLVEYFTAYYLEITHGGQKWWDYSGYFLNLDGRICAEGLVTFGIGGMAIVYVLAPLLDNHLRRIKYKYAIPLCAALVLLFATDQFYSKQHPNSGTGITDYTGASIVEQTEFCREPQMSDYHMETGS